MSTNTFVEDLGRKAHLGPSCISGTKESHWASVACGCSPSLPLASLSGHVLPGRRGILQYVHCTKLHTFL